METTEIKIDSWCSKMCHQVKKLWTSFLKFPTSVQVTLSIFLICVFITLLFAHAISAFVTLTAAASVSIFAALKYEFDRDSYNKDLFDKRMKIFSTLTNVLLQYQSSTKEKINDNSNNLHRPYKELKAVKSENKKIEVENSSRIKTKMLSALHEIQNESYFLFGKESYNFIDEIRKSFIKIQIFERNNDMPFQNSDPGQYEMLKEDHHKSTVFLRSYLNIDSLANKFPQLKIGERFYGRN